MLANIEHFQLSGKHILIFIWFITEIKLFLPNRLHSTNMKLLNMERCFMVAVGNWDEEALAQSWLWLSARNGTEEQDCGKISWTWQEMR